jgi:hypothetical protein
MSQSVELGQQPERSRVLSFHAFPSAPASSSASPLANVPATDCGCITDEKTRRIGTNAPCEFPSLQSKRNAADSEQAAQRINRVVHGRHSRNEGRSTLPASRGFAFTGTTARLAFTTPGGTFGRLACKVRTIDRIENPGWCPSTDRGYFYESVCPRSSGDRASVSLRDQALKNPSKTGVFLFAAGVRRA